MKKLDYFWARTLVHVFGVMFGVQLIIRLAGITEVKEGMEWVFPASGAAFGLSLLYSITLIIINTINSKKGGQSGS